MGKYSFRKWRGKLQIHIISFCFLEFAGSPRSGVEREVSMGPSIPAPIKDSPMLMMQLQDCQLALASLREESYRRKGEALHARLAKMKPIIVPSKIQEIQSPNGEKKDVSKEDVTSVDDLAKKVNNLRNRINSAMTSKNVVDLSQPVHKVRFILNFARFLNGLAAVKLLVNRVEKRAGNLEV